MSKSEGTLIRSTGQSIVGATDGTAVGVAVGGGVGSPCGLRVGDAVGAADGAAVGFGDGLSVGKKIGDVWVSMDGTVIRQPATWGSLKLTFNRLAAGLGALSGAGEGPQREEDAP